MARRKRPPSETGRAGAGKSTSPIWLKRIDKNGSKKGNPPPLQRGPAPGRPTPRATKALEKALARRSPKELAHRRSWHNGQGHEIVGAFV